MKKMICCLIIAVVAVVVIMTGQADAKVVSKCDVGGIRAYNHTEPSSGCDALPAKQVSVFRAVAKELRKSSLPGLKTISFSYFYGPHTGGNHVVNLFTGNGKIYLAAGSGESGNSEEEAFIHALLDLLENIEKKSK